MPKATWTQRSSLGALVILLGLVACEGSLASDPSDPGILAITSHDDGDIVDTDSIQVRGTAPAGAEIVQDITFASDKRTSADADGNWVLTVDLDEGDNDLTFRIGSENATAKTIRVVYDPGIAGEPSGPSNEPSDKPSNEPAESSRPDPTPRPTKSYRTFGDGDYIVGADIRPGTYRTRDPASLCYWERLSGFGGTLGEIIANDSGGGYFTVTIKKGDAGFGSSGCGTWTTDLSAVVSRRGPIDDEGVFIVGTDIAPGTWRSTGGGGFGCYAARLSGFGGTLNEVIANDLSTDGGLIITIQRSDKGFETSGCGTWTKVN